MKKTNIGMLIAYIVTLVLEIIPYGAVCIFAQDEGESIRRTYSYFDLVPFGYANFGPFLTAILTCAVLILIGIMLFKESKGLLNATRVVGGIAIVTSLMPLVFGTDYFTVVAVFITVVLAIGIGVSFIKNNGDKNQ